MPFRETIIHPPKTDRVNEEIYTQNQPIKPKTNNDSDCNGGSDDDDNAVVLEPGLVQITTQNRACTLQIRAVPLPPAATTFLEASADLICTLHEYSDSSLSERSDDQASTKLANETKNSLLEFKQKLKEVLVDDNDLFDGALECIWSFGPRRNGPNILLNRIEGYCRQSVWSCLEGSSCGEKQRGFDNSIISGFQLATLAGPMCEESLMGVCFIVEKWDVVDDIINVGVGGLAGIVEEEVGGRSRKLSECLDGMCLDDDTTAVCMEDVEELNEEKEMIDEISGENEDNNESDDNQDDDTNVSSGIRIAWKKELYGPMSGQIMSVMKEGCRQAFEAQPQRLMVAMYTCEVQCNSEVLGTKCIISH